MIESLLLRIEEIHRKCPRQILITIIMFWES